MHRIIHFVLLTGLVASFSQPTLAVQENEAGRKSIIRVITMEDGSGASDSEIETRVIEVDGTGASWTWVSELHLSRGYLGVRLLDLTPELRIHFGAEEDSGVMISQIVANGPAEAAGLEVGDILAAIEGKAVARSIDVSRAISDYEDGRTVVLELWRDRRAQTVTATLEERERPAIDLGRLIQRRVNGFETAPVNSRIVVRNGNGNRFVTASGLKTGEVIEIDEVGLQQALHEFELRVEDPHFVKRFKMLGRDRENLLERIEELEARLKELEKQLDKLPEE